MKNLLVSALQLDLFWQDAKSNHAHIEGIIRAMKPKGNILVLPEMFTTGFSMEPAEIAESPNGPSFQWMKKMANELESSLMGSVIMVEGGNYFNRAMWVNGAGKMGQYDKKHCFSLAGEDRVFQAGRERVIFLYKGWKICPQICYDLRFPVFSRNKCQDHKGFDYDVLIYMANWPATRIHHWESLLQARAIENQAYVVGVNRVGNDPNGLFYSGNSMIVDPMGKVIAKASGGEAVLEAELEFELLKESREKYPFWRDSDRFKLI